MRNMSLT